MPRCSHCPRPGSAQFLKNEFTLARFDRSEPTVEERRRKSGWPRPSVRGEAAETAKLAAPAVVQAVAQRPAAQPPWSTGPASRRRAAGQAEAAAAKPAKPRLSAGVRAAREAEAAPDRPAASPTSPSPRGPPRPRRPSPRPPALAPARPTSSRYRRR